LEERERERGREREEGGGERLGNLGIIWCGEVCGKEKRGLCQMGRRTGRRLCFI